MKLAKCPLRTRARIVHVDVDGRFDLRLQELGVRTGAEFSVVNRAAFGGRVINIAGTRIAVDHRSAQQISVEEVSVATTHATPTRRATSRRLWGARNAQQAPDAVAGVVSELHAGASQGAGTLVRQGGAQ